MRESEHACSILAFKSDMDWLRDLNWLSLFVLNTSAPNLSIIMS